METEVIEEVKTEPVATEPQEPETKGFMQAMKEFFTGVKAEDKKEPDEKDPEKKESDPAQTEPKKEPELNVEAMLKKEREKWEAEKAEEERLKKLSPEERAKEQQTSLQKELEDTKAELKAKKFKDTAITTLTGKGYPASLADILPYETYADNEAMEKGLDTLTTIFESSLKEVLLSKVKQETPRGLNGSNTVTGDSILNQIDNVVKKGGF
ncbi:DUF4355 domain-containing protein [[Clostridium] innocuum]|nr:DUF4355 domain-containing protein [[Clostridium] innocuum]